MFMVGHFFVGGYKSKLMQQFDLLGTASKKPIKLEDAELIFSPQFFDESFSLQFLEKAIDWQSEIIQIAGMERVVPRLTAWYGDNDAHYRYSGKVHYPNSWIEPLLEIKQKIENQTKETFNSVLCNLYRNGQDSVAWHADDEPELGINPVIASVSFGATRSFHLKHKFKPKLRHKIALTSGSLLIMKGKSQSHWLHQVPKEPDVAEPRINLTFRTIK